MAQRNGSGRGATATKTRTTDAASIRESDIAQLRADDIRSQLKRRGISGISNMRKDDLVKSLAKTLRAENRAAARADGKAAAAGRKAAAPAAKAAPSGRKAAVSGGKAAPSGRKAAVSGGKAAPAAGGARKTTAAAEKSTAGARKSTSVAAKKNIAAARKSTSVAAKEGFRSAEGGSRSLKYAQRISSPEERPDRQGRSLVTSDHDVIRQWAEARDAKPATIEGTEREGRAGVLTFDFPGWREGGRLRQITWDEWFQTFDLRKLNFIYQEQKTNGVQSNFFRTESPEREDA